MDGLNDKLIKFDEFCPICEFKDKKETEEPCNSCIEVGARVEHHLPVNFVERKRRKTDDEGDIALDEEVEEPKSGF